MKTILKAVLFLLLVFSVFVIFHNESLVDIALFQWSVELPIAAVICFALSMGVSIGIVLSNPDA
ncbi:hypothetical protein [Pseudocolwellia agarivorans]|uniref:hypothetical protein n=1 Tax=Pseudocolwellia agarivorans TaxID=1911682 RepID=UPI0009846DA9|nr:hypothetical protein [Pseudocolwellia agarivorans]